MKTLTLVTFPSSVIQFRPLRFHYVECSNPVFLIFGSHIYLPIISYLHTYTYFIFCNKMHDIPQNNMLLCQVKSSALWTDKGPRFLGSSLLQSQLDNPKIGVIWWHSSLIKPYAIPYISNLRIVRIGETSVFIWNTGGENHRSELVKNMHLLRSNTKNWVTFSNILLKVRSFPIADECIGVNGEGKTKMFLIYLLQFYT